MYKKLVQKPMFRAAMLVTALLVLLPNLATFAQDSETFTFWGGLIFSDEANSMFEARVKEWGEMKGVPVEVVMINQNETVQRVSAAIEAGNLPDALDLGWDFMLLLSQSDQLVGLDDLYAEIGDAHGGWLRFD